MWTMGGYESTASNATLIAVTPIPDGHLTVSGNDIRVPAAVPNLLAAAAMINSVAATPRVQLVTPSLRALVPFDVSPITNGLVFPSTAGIVNDWFTPFPLVPLEPLDAFAQNGASVVNRVFVWLGDGPNKPTTGKIFTVRATAGATLVTATWVNSGALTFASTLPAGHYQMVGMRSLSANQCAARVFFVGYPWRPGVIACAADATIEWPLFRYGNLGVFGEFDNTVPPTVDFMGITDTAQILYFDLIKTA